MLSGTGGGEKSGTHQFELLGGKEILDEPEMCRRYPPSGRPRLACGKPMINPQAPPERHHMPAAAAPLEYEQVAARDVGHPDALMTCQILRARRLAARGEILRCRNERSPGLPQGL